MMLALAAVIQRSHNKKLGPGVAATYAARHTCPPACPMASACYGESGPLRWHWDRVSREAPRTAAAEIADEARQLRQLTPQSLVRLHVVGDCPTPGSARRLASAAKRLRAWTYTHWWRVVPRKAWGTISALASCESTKGVRAARRRGYAAALVLPTFPSDKAFVVDGERVVPCPEQTGRAASCADCRLCLRDEWLRRSRTTIGFAVHGPPNTVEKRRATVAALGAAS